MDRLNLALQTAHAAVRSLEDLVAGGLSDDVRRDAAIQRFEYSFEACWKAAKRLLEELEGIRVATPKAVVRGAFQAGILEEKEAESALRMVDDRNLTVHTYNAAVAERLGAQVPGHCGLLRIWTDRMMERVQGQ